MDRRRTIGIVTYAFFAATWRHVQAACNQPQPVSGTRHNGTLAIYSPGDVLIFTCDTGYKANYNPPTITCIDISNDIRWNPPSISCELDGVSLVIAIVVTLVGIIIFVLAIIWLWKRRHPVKTVHGDEQLDDPYMDLVPTASPSSPYETLGTGSSGVALGNLYENGSVATQCQYANQIQNQEDQHTYDFI